MNILLIGAHGKVGQRLTKTLNDKGHQVRAMVRKKEQLAKLNELGGEAFFADLEEDFSAAYQGIDIVIFTAGSGGHTGPEKTIDIDQNAAIRSVDIAKQYNIKHYMMVSAQGVREPEAPSKIQHYYKAKRKADEHLITSGVPYTIFRPGRLSDEHGTGLIEAAEYIERRGETSRDNLAATITECIGKPNVTNRIIEVLEGNTNITEAINIFK